MYLLISSFIFELNMELRSKFLPQINDRLYDTLLYGLLECLLHTGKAEIEAQEVGFAILAPLRELDEVAYMRFASVYRNFASLEDFEGEIALLRAVPSSAISHSANSSVKATNEKSDAPSLKTNQTTTSNR